MGAFINADGRNYFISLYWYAVIVGTKMMVLKFTVHENR